MADEETFELEVAEEDILYRSVDEQGNEVGIAGMEDGQEVEYYYAGLDEDDLYWAALDLIEMDGFFVAEACLQNEGATVYTYVGISDDGYIEVYGFVPMGDGTVTAVACLIEFGDALSAETLAAVLQSVACADPVGEAAAALIAGGDASLGEGADGPILDPDYLARHATLV